MTILAFICKTPYELVRNYYMTKYFGDLLSDGKDGFTFEDYINAAFLGSLICLPLFSFLQSLAIDWLGKKTNMAVALVLLFKAFADTLSCYLIFYQDNTLWKIIGLYIDFAITKGQNGMYIVVLQTVNNE